MAPSPMPSPDQPVVAGGGSDQPVPCRQTLVVPVPSCLEKCSFSATEPLAWLSHGSLAAGGYQEIY